MKLISASKSKFAGVFFAFAGILGAHSGIAQDVAEPRVSLEPAWVVGAADGGERLVEGARPEGAVQRLYTARFRYEGTRPAPRLRIVLGIPDGMNYVANSALGPGAEIRFSVDGGRSFGAPAELSLSPAADDPEGEPRAARIADYSHIRWELAGPHLPGVAGLVSFRAVPGDGGRDDSAAPETP
ncbi:MAG TPA: hypothetical protein VMQ83_10440 [Gammaproteobacteria bacterium]|nr:hypothetical protein [Gammaproteobacteria bacterium]